MKHRALFDSDSDDGEDIFQNRRGSGPSAAGGGASRAWEDPLEAAPRAAASASHLGDAQQRGSAAVPLPESSKVSATRQNLAQLFGGVAPAMAAAASVRSPAPSLIDEDESRTADEGPSAAAPAMRPSFFAPSFEYDPNTAGGRSRRAAELGATSPSVSASAHLAAEDSAAAALAGTGLLTAEHAIVQAYRDSVYSGTCMVALCVPPTTATPSSAASPPPPPPPPSVALQRHLEQQQQPHQQGERTVPAASPVLLLMSSHRQVLCRLPLDDVFPSSTDGAATGAGAASFQLRQDAAQPQYLIFYDARRPSGRAADGTTASRRASGEGNGLRGGGDGGCWWTCMFPDRDKACRFLVAAYTVAQYAAALAKRSGASTSPVPLVRPLPPPERPARSAADAADTATVRPDVAARLCWQTWGLRRVSRQTLYCVPSPECLAAAAASPGSPRTVVPRGDGSGPLWDCVAEAVVGMRSGASRLVFVPAGEARRRHPAVDKARGTASSTTPPGMPALDTPAVVYVTCVDAMVSETGGAGEPLPPPPLLPPPPPTTNTSDASAAAPAAATPSVVDPLSSTAVLQQLLLHTLQQQPPPPASAAPPPGLDTMERSLERVQLQLSSLYEKIDRLDIETKLRHNNAELERVMRRVVGLAPQEEVAIEDALKDRDALLASIERYRSKYEEANTNYQRALEAMGRSSDRAQALEKDLHLQQDLWTRQRREEAEQARLRLVERDARHRDELARVAEERYAAGKSDGHAAGYREGRQATLLEVEGGGGGGGGGGAVVTEWRARLMAKDQELVSLQAALQDAKFHHERDRRQLRAEIDVVSELNEKLQHLQANADVRLPEETAQQQSKRVKRTLNAVYARAEAELLQRPAVPAAAAAGAAEGQEAPHLVALDDVLAVLMTAIRAEAQAATAQIRDDEARRVAGNAAIRDRVAARRLEHGGTSAETRLQLAWTSAGADAGDTSTVTAAAAAAPPTSSRRADVSGGTGVRQTPPPPPPLPPPVHTAASHDALAAMEATLLPEVAHATSTAAAAAGPSGADAGTAVAAEPVSGDTSPPRGLPARPTVAPPPDTTTAASLAAPLQEGGNGEGEAEEEEGEDGEAGKRVRASDGLWGSPGTATTHPPPSSGFQAPASTAPPWMRAGQNPFVSQQPASARLAPPAPTPLHATDPAETRGHRPAAPSPLTASAPASPPSPAALPRRGAVRLPADPPAATAASSASPRSAHTTDDEAGVDGDSGRGSSPPPSPPRGAGLSAAAVVLPATASSTPPHDAADFSSPSTALRDWQGTRLFKSPPSAPG